MKALITGATSGMGRDMAIVLAEKGWELVLTGRNEKELRRLKKILPVKTEIIALDLAEDNAPYELYKFCRGMDIDLLVNNAGFGRYGKFHETDLSDDLDMISVNIRAVHILTKLFVRDFRRKDRGRILNVASSAGFMTGPSMSTYYASKNYVVRLSLAVAEELRQERSNVSVSVFCPGPVQTNFNKRAGAGFLVVGMSSREAAEYAIDKTLAGKRVIIPGAFMKLSVFATRFVPHTVLPAVINAVQKGREYLN